jgi:mRNA interferase YafQ
MLLLIAGDAPLGAEWLDHPLRGDWADHRECHIGGDFLLIYRLEGQAILFVRVCAVNCTEFCQLRGAGHGDFSPRCGALHPGALQSCPSWPTR